MKKQMVEETLDHMDTSSFVGNIAQIIERFVALTKKYKVEGWQNLRFEENHRTNYSTNEYEVVGYYLLGSREETDKEYEARIHREKASKKRDEEAQLRKEEKKKLRAQREKEREHRLYLKLKNKFEEKV